MIGCIVWDDLGKFIGKRSLNEEMGLRPYHALLGLTQTSGLAGGYDISSRRLDHIENSKLYPWQDLSPLLQFSLPILVALLQNMYDAVNMLVVGRYVTASDVATVSTDTACHLFCNEHYYPTGQET